MEKEKEIPRGNLREMEPPSYADGDFDIVAWQDEIMDMRADDITDDSGFGIGSIGNPGEDER